MSTIKLPEGVELIKGLTHKNFEKLINIYQTSDILLLPTKKDQIPNVINEAIAAKLPIISNDIGAIHEMVIDNYNGFLMPVDSSIEEWKDKVNILLNNETIYDKFSNNAKDLAIKKLSKNIFIDNLNYCISKVLKYEYNKIS